MGLFNKKELKRIEELEKENAEYLSKIEQLGGKEILDIQNEIKELQGKKANSEKELAEKEQELQNIQKDINNLLDTIKVKKEVINQLDLDLDVMDFGKPIIGLRPWGQERVPSKILNNATVMVGWNRDSLISAIRQYAL